MYIIPIYTYVSTYAHNIGSRPSKEVLELELVPMLAMFLLIFWGNEHLVKKLADPDLRQGNLLHRNNFSGFYKTSLHFTKLSGNLLKTILTFLKQTSSTHSS
jgi:hypothetical protein